MIKMILNQVMRMKKQKKVDKLITNIIIPLVIKENLICYMIVRKIILFIIMRKINFLKIKMAEIQIYPGIHSDLIIIPKLKE